jgi:hypothetical protein
VPHRQPHAPYLGASRAWPRGFRIGRIAPFHEPDQPTARDCRPAAFLSGYPEPRWRVHIERHQRCGVVIRNRIPVGNTLALFITLMWLVFTQYCLAADQLDDSARLPLLGPSSVGRLVQSFHDRAATESFSGFAKDPANDFGTFLVLVKNAFAALPHRRQPGGDPIGQAGSRALSRLRAQALESRSDFSLDSSCERASCRNVRISSV